MMQIYKQKTELSLYYIANKPAIIFEDPIFQTACKLMIYLKILAYKYENADAERIVNLNLSSYMKRLKSLQTDTRKNENDETEKPKKEEEKSKEKREGNGPEKQRCRR